MNRGLLTLPLLPIRSEPSERSEMTTQLLFGEMFEILEESDNWSLIRNDADNYEGWATSKMLTSLTDEMKLFLLRFESHLITSPIEVYQKLGTDKETYHLPAGSRLFHSNEIGKTFFLPSPSADGYDLFEMKALKPVNKKTMSVETTINIRFVNTALQFLNSPYLWGGKSIMGMDCSGLVQVSAAICGINLPRDAKDQQQIGNEVTFEHSLPGDIAFFRNESGQIIHVGIVFGPNTILHASGSVRLDPFTSSGIIHKESLQQTHRLHSVKRIF